MRKTAMLLILAVAGWVAGLSTLQSSAPSSNGKRINRAIELLDQGQPIYVTYAHGGYEEGKKMAQTWADYLNYDMEHDPYDVSKLADFMQGLADGGPPRAAIAHPR